MALVKTYRVVAETDSWSGIGVDGLNTSRSYELIMWVDPNSPGDVKIKKNSTDFDYNYAILPRNGAPISIRFVFSGTDGPVVQSVGPDRGLMYVMINEV